MHASSPVTSQPLIFFWELAAKRSTARSWPDLLGVLGSNVEYLLELLSGSANGVVASGQTIPMNVGVAGSRQGHWFPAVFDMSSIYAANDPELAGNGFREILVVPLPRHKQVDQALILCSASPQAYLKADRQMSVRIRALPGQKTNHVRVRTPAPPRDRG
jgi:hypothetical protein